MGDFPAEGSVKPKYDSYCLSNVTSTLLSILGVENGRTKLPADVFDGVDTTGVENVVLFALDGLGWSEWQRQTSSGFFGKMNERGSAMPITTVFPSTTSTALTTLLTGLTPQEHALIEWYLYLKEADMVIQTLPFSPAGSRGTDLLLPKVDPRVLFDGESVFGRLRSEGVMPHSYLNRYISRSAYSRLVHGASEVHGYSGLSDLSVMLTRTLESSKGPSFHYVYWSSVDTLQHLYGPGSEEAHLEANGVSQAFKAGLLDRLEGKAAAKTLFVATADHGHVCSPMAKASWLDARGKLMKSLAKSATGKTILPWGAPRDVYIRVEDDEVDEVYGYLSDSMAAEATVVKSADAAASGLFGTGNASQRFPERVGNIMVLPKGKRSVWYRVEGVEPPDLVGQHGGMHEDEMTIPLAIARASSVVD